MRARHKLRETLLSRVRPVAHRHDDYRLSTNQTRVAVRVSQDRMRRFGFDLFVQHMLLLLPV